MNTPFGTGSGFTRAARLCAAAALLFTALGQSSHAQSTPNSAFTRLWERSDYPVAAGRAQRSWLWGPKPNSTMPEPNAESPGGTRETAYYDKARMEINNPSADRSSPWYVTNGLLPVEMISGRISLGGGKYEQRAPAALPIAGDQPAPGTFSTAPTYAAIAKVATLAPGQGTPDRTGQEVDQFLATDGSVQTRQQFGNPDTSAPLPRYAYYSAAVRHNIPDVFWEFLNTTGLVFENGKYVQGKLFDWVYTMGYPVTEPYWISAPVAGRQRQVLAQVFERRVLTYNPANPAGWRVEMGNVGEHYYRWRYGAKLSPSPTPAAPGASRDLSLRRIATDRSYSAITGQLYEVDTTQDAFARLWQRHKSYSQPAPPPPAVDFSKEIVVAAFWGDQANSCYRLDILRVNVTGSQITVTADQQTPKDSQMCLQVITQPHDIVAVPRTGLASGKYMVRFVNSQAQELFATDLSVP